MKSVNKEIKYVNYCQSGEPPRHAGITEVEITLDGLYDNELQVIGHLSEAVDQINQIFQSQLEPKTSVIRRVILGLQEVADQQTSSVLSDYVTILDLQNGPYSRLPRKNHLLGLERAEVERLVKSSGDQGLQHDYEQIAEFLFEGLDFPDRAGFYPPDISEEEYTNLGSMAEVVNSSVIREDDHLRVVLNEERYREQLASIIESLRQARNHAQHPGFQTYLDAKILELSFGTEEARRVADTTWVRHNSRINLILSSALEVYLDNWKNARGAASGAVLVENTAGKDLLNALVDQITRLEAIAPWTHKKTEIDPETLPKLQFVDVFNWSGDYISSPMTTIAQSLPNDVWVQQNIGTVNLVFMNTGRAVHRITGKELAREFLPTEIFERYHDKLFDAGQLITSLHELGHTTGLMDPEHRDKEPRVYLEEEYSTLEELRAELFSLWASPQILQQGIIDQETMNACYTSMLMTMLNAMKFAPNQAHTKARNMMFHYFIQHGAVIVSDVDGKTLFEPRFDKFAEVATEMLGFTADVKAAGAKQKAVQFREKWCFDDPLRAEIEHRTAHLPMGRGLIFPRIKKVGDLFMRELISPASFSSQTRYQRT